MSQDDPAAISRYRRACAELAALARPAQSLVLPRDRRRLETMLRLLPRAERRHSARLLEAAGAVTLSVVDRHRGERRRHGGIRGKDGSHDAT
jgi:hypothetical protein